MPSSRERASASEPRGQRRGGKGERRSAKEERRKGSSSSEKDGGGKKKKERTPRLLIGLQGKAAAPSPPTQPAAAERVFAKSPAGAKSPPFVRGANAAPLGAPQPLQQLKLEPTFSPGRKDGKNSSEKGKGKRGAWRGKGAAPDVEERLARVEFKIFKLESLDMVKVRGSGAPLPGFHDWKAHAEDNWMETWPPNYYDYLEAAMSWLDNSFLDLVAPKQGEKLYTILNRERVEAGEADDSEEMRFNKMRNGMLNAWRKMSPDFLESVFVNKGGWAIFKLKHTVSAMKFLEKVLDREANVCRVYAMPMVIHVPTGQARKVAAKEVRQAQRGDQGPKPQEHW